MIDETDIERSNMDIEELAALSFMINLKTGVCEKQV